MGVFEFVLAIIFMSFVFKTINLRYESQKNNQTNGEAYSLGVSSAMERKEQPSKRAAQKSAGTSPPWRFLFFAACCLIPMAFFFLASLSDRIQPVPAMPEMAEAPWSPEGPAPAPVVVPVPIDANSATRLTQPEEAPDEFLADVYPSIVDCAAPLAIKVYNEISDRLPTRASPEAEDSGDEKDEDNENKIAEKETVEPTEFYITNDFTNGGLSEQDYVPFVIAFRKKIEAKVENSSVKDVTDQGMNDFLGSPKSAYRILVSEVQKFANGEIDHTAGRVVCRVRAKDLSTEVITPYVRKLWLTDFKAYSKQNPDRKFAVGRDDGFSPNLSQAREQAIRNALVGSTVDYRLIDEVCQKYERPYGDVFRCSVLLELDESRQVTITHPVNVNHNTNAVRSQPTLLSSLFDCDWKPSFEWSIALLIGLTVIIGTISNALTQGYYRTEISGSVLVMVALGFCLLIAIIVSAIG